MTPPIAAELLKQSRQHSLLFWGFAAVPLFTTLLAFALEAATPAVAGTPLGIEVHPIRSAMRAMSVGGNPVAHLFFAIGAAGIFCVEYRHASWRHIVPRCSRTALMTAKFAVYASFAVVSLALVLIGDLFASMVPVLARGMTMADSAPATLPGLASAFLVSLAELFALGGTVALMAVLTRSTLGAVLPPFLLSLGAASLGALLAMRGDQLATLPLPTFAADAVRSWIWAEPQNPGISGEAALASGAMLLAWSIATFGASVMIFRRQDLTAE